MPANADTLISSATLANASELYNVGKSILTSGVVIGGIVWALKKIVSHFTKNNEDIHSQNLARGQAIDKKENDLLEMLKQMLEKKSEHTISVVQHTNAVVSVTQLIASHTVLLEKHTQFAEKISRLLELQRTDFLHSINERLEKSFEVYVDNLQKNPEIAKKILANRNNVINSVLSEVSEAMELAPLTAPD